LKICKSIKQLYQLYHHKKHIMFHGLKWYSKQLINYTVTIPTKPRRGFSLQSSSKWVSCYTTIYTRLKASNGEGWRMFCGVVGLRGGIACFFAVPPLKPRMTRASAWWYSWGSKNRVFFVGVILAAFLSGRIQHGKQDISLGGVPKTT